MNLAIAGLTASGKTYQARKLAQNFGLEYVSGSKILLDVAGLSPTEDLFWISEPGIRFAETRIGNSSLDRRTDELILQMAESKKGIVFDSITLPWLYQGSNLIRIYLAANAGARAHISLGSRDVMPYSLREITELIKRKDEYTIQLFKEMYGITIGETSGFDLVVDNSNLSRDETSRTLSEFVVSVMQPSPTLDN